MKKNVAYGVMSFIPVSVMDEFNPTTIYGSNLDTMIVKVYPACCNMYAAQMSPCLHEGGLVSGWSCYVMQMLYLVCSDVELVSPEHSARHSRVPCSNF
jgi:hypothetical protein